MNTYDIAIVGGGAGGFAAAVKSAELGAKTIMINSGLPLGGTCVNVGCVPSKFLINKAKINHILSKNGSKGISFEDAIEQELSLVDTLRKAKYENVLKGLGIRYISGRAERISDNEIWVNGEKIRAEKIIIATGSRYEIPEILKGVSPITNVEALRMKKLPKNLAIVGAGPMGLEFAQLFSRFGSNVYVIEIMPSIFPRGEKSLVAKLQEILEEEGIKFFLSAKIRKAYRENNKKMIEVEYEDGKILLEVDEVLFAGGKKPNTEFLHGIVEMKENGAIIVDEYLRTSKDNIYAVGDCVALPKRLETTAAAEGTIAVENALLSARKKIDYDIVPYTIFTDPEFSSVGLTEEEVARKFGKCSCREISFDLLPKARIVGERGWIKIVLGKEQEIAGIHILSPNASEVIFSATLIVKNKMKLEDVISLLPVFPSFSESIKLCALSFMKDIENLPCCV